MRDPADDNGHWEPVHCQHCDGCRRVWLGAHASAAGVLWPEGHCPACERDTWWDEAFQRQARTAEQYRAEGRAQEAERIAAWCDIPRPELCTWLPGLQAVARFIRGAR
jgi:hypothetical protein